MEPDQVTAYFRARRKILKQARPFFKRKTFSFEHPHTCSHCKSVVLRILDEYAGVVCWKCGMRSTQLDLTADKQHYLCPRCGDQAPAHRDVTFSCIPPYNLAEAILASESGCALYEWLVDVVAYNTLGQPDDKPETYACFYSTTPAFHLTSPSSDPGGNGLCELKVNTRLTAPQDLDATHHLPSDRLQAQGWAEARNTSFYLMSQLEKQFKGSTEGTFHIPPFWSTVETLYGWTLPSDPVSRHITSRPYENDVGSHQSLEFARSSFQTCLQTHMQCHRHGSFDENLAPDQIPSRLLDVGPRMDPSLLKLVEVQGADARTKSHIATSGYASLSYCWGGDQPIKLVAANRQQLTSGVAISDLPRTLRDAIWIAREMEMDYLWIDALCIIQDDVTDKNQELARMASYYNCAKLTISAASSPNCAEGFLAERDTATFNYQMGPIRLSLNDGQGEVGNVYILKEGLEDPTNPSIEPIATRAWTLQESLLSRRILIFSSKQLYWSCVASFSGSGGHSTKFVDRISGTRESLVDNIYPLGSLENMPTQRLWQFIIQDFTRRRISFQGDKLPAVSALATRLSQLCEERGEPMLYFAGLSVKPSTPASWHSQLLWSSDILESERARPYRAPSWSWAAIEGPIDVNPFEIHESLDRYADAWVEGFQLDLEFPTNPFGQVTDASLALRARILSLTECPDEPYVVNSEDGTFEVTDQARGFRRFMPSTRGLALFPDTNEDLDIIEAGLLCKEVEPPCLLCLWLGNDITCGLILVLAVDSAFSRIGTFCVRTNLNGTILFSDCQHQIVRLV